MVSMGGLRPEAGGSYRPPVVGILPGEGEVDATMQAFSQWLSEMRSRSTSSSQHMFVELESIWDGINSNSTDLGEYKRHSISIQQQLQSQLTDLRAKLASASSEITSLAKQKAATTQELASEIRALQQQLSAKGSELEALKRSHTSEHQQLQSTLIQIQGQIQGTNSEIGNARKQAQVVQDEAQRKMDEIDRTLQRIRGTLEQSGQEGQAHAMLVHEDIGKLQHALRGLSADFLEHKRFAQQMQCQLSSQVSLLEESYRKSAEFHEDSTAGHGLGGK